MAADSAVPGYPHPLVEQALANADASLTINDSRELDLPWKTFDVPFGPLEQDGAADTVQAGDFNGDGRMDLAFVDQAETEPNGHLVIWTAVTSPDGGPPSLVKSYLTSVTDGHSNYAWYLLHSGATLRAFPDRWFVSDFNAGRYRMWSGGYRDHASLSPHQCSIGGRLCLTQTGRF